MASYDQGETTTLASTSSLSTDFHDAETTEVKISCECGILPECESCSKSEDGKRKCKCSSEHELSTEQHYQEGKFIK